MNRKWHVMRTIPGREPEAAALLERKVSHILWSDCRILKKQQLFRMQGSYFLSRKDMFPGYIFVCTKFPEELVGELRKAREFPQLVGNQMKEMIPIEEMDLHFLENVCGKDLVHDMWLSTVRVDDDGQVRSASGALEPYVGRITRQRLRHRYVTAEVPLFNRVENILFGIRVEGDPG